MYPVKYINSAGERKKVKKMKNQVISLRPPLSQPERTCTHSIQYLILHYHFTCFSQSLTRSHTGMFIGTSFLRRYFLPCWITKIVSFRRWEHVQQNVVSQPGIIIVIVMIIHTTTYIECIVMSCILCESISNTSLIRIVLSSRLQLCCGVNVQCSTS